MFVCTCSYRGPHGRLALPNEPPSLNNDVHFTSLHSTSLHFTIFTLASNCPIEQLSLFADKANCPPLSTLSSDVANTQMS